MKKFLFLLMCFTVSSVVFAPVADAWTWKTHSDIADAVYYGLPPEVQKNLNLKTMEDASNDPDQVFKDFTDHSYPKSYNEANYWLDKGKTAYSNGDYQEASYDFGVASHYISDTFSAPHCVSHEKSSDHSKYENQAKKLIPTATFKNEDLNTLMQEGYNKGASSWSQWLQTKSNDAIQNNLNDGASAALSAIKSSIIVQTSSQPVNINNNSDIQNTTNTTSYPENNAPKTSYVPIGIALLLIIGVVYFIIKSNR